LTYKQDEGKLSWRGKKHLYLDEEWHAIKTTLQDTAMETLGKEGKGSKKEWFSQEIFQIAAERRQLKPKRRNCTANRRHYNNYLCKIFFKMQRETKKSSSQKSAKVHRQVRAFSQS